MTDSTRILRIANRVARDAPLNMGNWFQKKKKFLKWAVKQLKTTSSLKSYAEINERIYEEDRYSFVGFAFFEDFDYYTRKMNDIISTCEIQLSRLEDPNTRFPQLIKSLQYLKDDFERFDLWGEGFRENHPKGIQVIQDSLDYKDSSFSESDMKSYHRLGKEVKRYFNIYDDIRKGLTNYQRDLQTIIDWGGNEGPQDRTQVDKLYHTTSALSKIKSQGFKTDVKGGLGGATDGMVSTTMSKKVALGIAIALRKMVKVAKGQANLKTLLAWSKKAGIFDTIINEYSPYLKRLISEYGEKETVSMIDKGYMMEYINVLKKLTISDLPNGSIPLEYWYDGGIVLADKLRKDLKETAWVTRYWHEDRGDHSSFMKNMFQRYLSAIEQVGRGYNPLFFGVDLEDFQKINPNDIGTFEMEVDMSDPRINYVAGMYEYRIPTEAILSFKTI